MERESRVKKSILNARINLICYFVSLLTAFFTRKVFLDNLGAEFIGLTGTLSSLLGFLNLAELGVGSAIGYVLYKPIYDGDKGKISEVISLLGYLYQKIGLVILGSGVILSLFLPLIFSDTPFSWGVIYLGFYSYLAASMLSYFVNYRMSLLSADQRNYEVTGLFQITTTTRLITQMLLAIKFQSFVLYIILEVLFGVINSVVLNRRISTLYPWLESDLRLGRQLFKKYPDVWRYIKQIFVHKIASFVQFQLTPMLIYPFTSLAMVALYGNYKLLSDNLQRLSSNVLDSTGAGVGNLISSGDHDRVYMIFRELFSVRMLFAGVISACVLRLSSDFIGIWLGAEYILPSVTVVLISIYMFLIIARGATDQFLFGYGLFADVWAPIMECVILIVCSLIGGYLWGLNGVLLGPVASIVIIVHIWKPYYLFSSGLKQSILSYIWLLLKHITPLAVSFYLSCEILFRVIARFGIDCSSWIGWLVESAIFALLMGFISFALSAVVSRDLRLFIRRFVKIK